MEPKIKVTVEIEHVVLKADLKDPAHNVALFFLLKMCEDSAAKDIAQKWQEAQAKFREIVKNKEEETP